MQFLRKITGRLVLLLSVVWVFQACELLDLDDIIPNDDPEEEVIPLENINFTQEGEASYYADRFEGRPTASGEPFRQDSLTAAHRHLPFGTVVRITNLKNNKQIVVRINDRGPFVEGRIIDVSRRGAEALDFIRDGLADVRIEAALSEEDAKKMDDLLGR